MLLAAIPRDRGDCRLIGLNVTRAGGTLRVGLLLCDGAIPAQDAPARLIFDDANEENLFIRVPALDDAPYPDFELEII